MRFVLIVGLLTSLFLLFPSSPAHASSLSSTFYTYDNLGNIQTMNNTVDTAKSVSYTYDDIYRLERVSGGYSSNYIYDADGNILTKNEDQNLTLTYIPSDSIASHGPKSVNGRLLRYDPNGNLIEDAFSNLKIVYDYDNRPVEIRKLDSHILIAKYYYDGEGKRVKKEVYANNTLSKTTQYVNQYFEKEIPIAGQTTVRKFYAGAAYRENGTLTYTTTDHLSSTTLTTNTQGQKIAHYVYYPYGSPNLQLTTNLPAMLRPLAAMQRLRASIAMQAGNSQPLPNSWIGQKRDTESNLYFLNARYYSPAYGRFVSVDSVNDPVTRGNKYSYVGENPIGRNDPEGLCTTYEECLKHYPYLAKLISEAKNQWKQKYKNYTGDIEKVNVNVFVSSELDYDPEGRKQFHFMRNKNIYATADDAFIIFRGDVIDDLILSQSQNDYLRDLIEHEFIHSIQYSRNKNFGIDYKNDSLFRAFSEGSADEFEKTTKAYIHFVRAIEALNVFASQDSTLGKQLLSAKLGSYTDFLVIKQLYEQTYGDSSFEKLFLEQIHSEPIQSEEGMGMGTVLF